MRSFINFRRIADVRTPESYAEQEYVNENEWSIEKTILIDNAIHHPEYDEDPGYRMLNGYGYVVTVKVGPDLNIHEDAINAVQWLDFDENRKVWVPTAELIAIEPAYKDYTFVKNDIEKDFVASEGLMSQQDRVLDKIHKQPKPIGGWDT